MDFKELIKFGLEESSEPIIKNPVLRDAMAEGGMSQLVTPSVDGSRPGYSGKMKWTTKEVQEIYKDLPEGMNVQKRTLPSGKIDYTYRARVRGDRIGKPNWDAKSMVATPENKKKMIELVEAKYDEYYPKRLNREEYAKLRLKPENRRLRGEDFAKKLNSEGYTTATGSEWNRGSVYNFDKDAPRGKPIAKDLGFFEKRTVAEAKDIINQYSGGKHFLKNKNLTDSQITTRAAEYVAMEKNIEKTGGTYSFPRGKQNKRKVWQNIYSSHDQNGRFKLANADELPKAKNGKILWRKDKAWRKAKFKDTKSGKIFTYGNLEEMVDKHGGGWNKAIKAYDDNARLNQTTFKGKSLNEWFREGMIKKEYETLIEKKVPWKDKGLQKYMGEKKPYYSFTEAHHFKGVKDNPFDTESSFRYANRRQGNIQNSYDKAIKSGNPDRIAKAKIKYAEDMKSISDDLGGIRFNMDNKRFGKKGTEESIIRAGAKASGMSDANKIKLFKQLGYRCAKAGGAGESVECYLADVEKTKADIKNPKLSQNERAMALTKQRNALKQAQKIPKLMRGLRRGVQGVSSFFGGWIGGVAEGLFEIGSYDYYRGKGLNHEQALQEGMFSKALGEEGNYSGIFGGSEELVEKEKIGTRWDPSGKVNLAAKYADAKSKFDEAIDKYNQINANMTTYASEEDWEKDLNAQAKIIADLESSVKPGTPEYEAYQQAEEKQTALMDKRGKDYKSKNRILDFEWDLSPAQIKQRTPSDFKERQILKRREKEADIYKGGLDNFYLKPGEYIDWGEYNLDDQEGIQSKWKDIYEMGGMDLFDKVGIAGGVSKMAGGGIAEIRRPSAIPPESGPTPYGLPSMLNHVKKV